MHRNDEYKSKKLFRKAVLKMGFKNKAEARAYYFILLVGSIVE